MADLSPLYDALAPNPDADYGSILPYARNRPGSASWVQNGADTRWALPSVIREGLKGYLDLAQGTETGKVTPEALQAVVFGGMGAGAMMAPRGALAAGASRLPKGDIPEALYHVAGPTYRAGNDLKPPVNFLSRREALDAFRAKWPEGDPSHINKVFFHDDLAKAQRHKEDFGGTILQVDPRLVRDLHVDDIEPEWATRYLVPANALRKYGLMAPAPVALPTADQRAVMNPRLF